MKTIINLLSKGVLVISIDGFLQFVALATYLNLALGLTPKHLKIFIEYGLPYFVVFLGIFAVAIPITGGWLMMFLYKLEKGEQFTDDELIECQRRVINFPFRVALLGLFNWTISVPPAIYFMRSATGWSTSELIIGSVGGFIGGILCMPIALYATGMITYAILDMIKTKSPTIPRGGRVGVNMPLSLKISMSFFVILFGFVVMIALAGYSRINRLQFDEVYGGLMINFALLSISMLGLTILLAVLTARYITGMLDRLQDTTSEIARGNLEIRAEVITNDEVGILAKSINDMGEKLEENSTVMKNLQKDLDASAAKLHDATNNILVIAKQHSSSATQQSVAIKEVATTQDMILDTARQVAESADKSDKIAGDVLVSTTEGIKHSSKTVEGIEKLSRQVEEFASVMHLVNDCTQRVSEALGVIDEIAERTNLLSLNASLEAAGSAEHGKRFAVVADQIRRLAEQSKASAKTIARLVDEIDETTKKASDLTELGLESAKEGVLLVRDIQKGLDRINSVAGRSSELAQHIDKMSQQQHSSLKQAATTLGEIVETTEQTLDGTRKTEEELAGIKKLAEHIRSMLSAPTDEIDDIEVESPV